MLTGKRVVVGVCGGIAAYKTVDVVSRLKRLNADVRVIMTRSACEFITPLTFQSISKNPVITNAAGERLDKDKTFLDEADALLIVPATANMIGKLAYDISDDMLSSAAVSIKGAVILAPAVNSQMYNNVVLQGNIKKLSEEGVIFIEPEAGLRLGGRPGKGRLAPIEIIVEKVCEILAYPKDLCGIKVLVTAGPTRETIDSLRYISNYSTGKIGYSVARAAKYRGAKVTLVTGPTHIRKVSGVDVVEVNSAMDMYNAVLSLFDKQDIVVKSAAVGDFRAAAPRSDKMKTAEKDLSVQLTPNPNILSELGRRLKKQVLVGFCAECENLLENATEKLREKNLDLIVANDLYHDGAGYAIDINGATIISKTGESTAVPSADKDNIAHEILSKAKMIYESKCG